jgi:Family of unknown function (DUF6502)
MNSTLQNRLIQCISSCLRPLVRIMLRSGIGYRQFAELAKLAFVQEASGEKGSRGRQTNLSRVAIRTGISRKEVARLQSQIEGHSGASSRARGVDFHSVHAARVLQLWHSDPRFIDSDGSPRKLPFADDGIDFSSIVKAAGGDVPPGAVRAEMLSANAVVEFDDGTLKPTKRYFVPADVGEELLVGFTHMVIPVLEGLARNTDYRCTEPFIQRLVYSDRLAPRVVPLFRKQARERVSDFVQSVDDWLSSNEIPDSQVHSPCRYGVGVFYYEGLPSVPEDMSVTAAPEEST